MTQYDEIMDFLNKLEETGEMRLFVEKIRSKLDDVPLNEAFDEYLDDQYDLSNAGDIFSDIAPSEALYALDYSTYCNERDHWAEGNEHLIEIKDQYYWIDNISQALDDFDAPGIKLERIKHIVEQIIEADSEIFIKIPKMMILKKLVS